MAWNNLTWSTGDLLTSSDMNLLQDNISAVCSASAGAPTLVHSAIGDSVFSGATIIKAKQSEFAIGMPPATTYYPSSGWWSVHINGGNGYLQIEVDSSWITLERPSVSTNNNIPLGLYISNGKSFRSNSVIILTTTHYWVGHES